MTTPPASSLPAPEWSHCSEGVTAADRLGCRGIVVPGHLLCLAHLAPADRATYLTTLSPGDDIDHRGTTFTESLLNELLNALRDLTTGRPRFGKSRFDSATFSNAARFQNATFTDVVQFGNATFSDYANFGTATFCALTSFRNATFSAQTRFADATFSAFVNFDGVRFTDRVTFHGATFSYASFVGASFSANVTFLSAKFTDVSHFDNTTFCQKVYFGRARFTDETWFDSATFTGDADFGTATFFGRASFDDARFATQAEFDDATFTEQAWFGGATFSGHTRFDGASFSHACFDGAEFFGHAGFEGAIFSVCASFCHAEFSGAGRLGPLTCQGDLDLSAAIFAVPVTIEAAAKFVWCLRTRWESTATLRLRYAAVDLSDAVITQPIAVTAHAAPFRTAEGVETGLTGDAGVRIMSLRGVDAAHMVLTNTDLAECRFFGAFHLDQLRLEGETLFARTPSRIDIRRGIPLWWTHRLALAEEHHWRALPEHRPRLRAGWTAAPPQSGPAARLPGPPALASLYRQLRKAFEDSKDEPGASDFYYAETEMRRLDRRHRRSRAERGLLTGYWALSGYGLRASRALAWLALAMTTTVITLMMWGLPTNDPKPRTIGTLPEAGQVLALTTNTAAPAVTGTLGGRFTAERATKAIRIAVNSVIFRSSGQNLTTTGENIEMASRFFEPVLLGFAAVAIRNRVKR
ncbi:pentapeptide repeat-containing protein [Streptomyces sp. NPDC060366]|uniref:pentapeptide repeat-containing protein n=1 Tax=Streptomyces sp. NPDC060366 TaxID=3347105 RepID=UPI003663064C